MKDMLKETINYLDTNFENWRKSPFLKFVYSIKRGFKHIAFWGVALLYKMKLPIVVSPTEPTTLGRGLMWLDTGDKDNNGTNDNILKIYDGSKWLVVHFQ